MNALSNPSSVEQQSQTSNDARPPASSVRTQQNGVEFVSQERMSILGLEGTGFPLAAPPGPGRLRQAVDALLKRGSVTTKLLVAFLADLKLPLQRALQVLLKRWIAAVFRVQRAQHVLLERWMAADFRSRQLPILAIAATIWASTAWMAWRSEDSSTPLLRNNLAAMSQRVQTRELAAGPASRVMAEPVASQGAVQHGLLTQQFSPSLLLDRIVDFLISRPTPPHKRPADPRLQVWTNTHTGLYYCPGEDGYRRRSRGHFMSQEEAQNNYFQPASGAACP